MAAPLAAQTLDTIITVQSGTGMSVGRGAVGVARQRSPIFLEVDVGLVFDGLRHWEFTPSLLLELENRVAVAVNPSVKRVFRPWRRIGLYAGAGLPVFFAPFTMLGAEVALGGFFNIVPRFGVVVELRADVFFLGSDLPGSTVVAKLDAALGLRLEL